MERTHSTIIRYELSDAVWHKTKTINFFRYFSSTQSFTLVILKERKIAHARRIALVHFMHK